MPGSTPTPLAPRLSRSVALCASASSWSMSVTSSSSKRRGGKTPGRRRRNDRLPYDGDSVLPQGSRRGTLRSVELVIGSISGRRRGAGEGAQGQGPPANLSPVVLPIPGGCVSRCGTDIGLRPLNHLVDEGLVNPNVLDKWRNEMMPRSLQLVNNTRASLRAAGHLCLASFFNLWLWDNGRNLANPASLTQEGDLHVQMSLFPHEGTDCRRTERRSGGAGF